MSLRSCMSFVAFVALAQSAAASEIGYYSQPTIWDNRIVFVSEGDLWTATLSESLDAPITAYRLTSSDGDESHPLLSPDGEQLAFTAEYDGNSDVYVMPAAGGVPKRLTFHPDGDTVIGWTPDGRNVLFRSGRKNPFGRSELYKISTQGGMPQRYDFGECSMIGMSSTGRRAAFTRWSNENWTWKRYRGGTAPDIWVGDLQADTYRNLTDTDANELHPMWMLGRVFFISDRDGLMNLYSDSPEGGDLKQHTSFTPDAADPTAASGYDIRWASGELRRRGDRIVFCQGGGLVLYDITNDTTTRLDMRIASDRIESRQRFGDVADTMTEYELSADGKHLLVGTRGELLSIPVEGGPPLQLTRTSSAREWGMGLLGENRVALISDQPGEQQIAVVALDGAEPPGAVTQDQNVWMFPPRGSIDGQWIAFGDKTLRLNVLDMNTFEPTLVDESKAGEITDYRFSPDSQWLAYTFPDENGYSRVKLYALRTGRSFDVSTGLQNDHSPRWDPAGKYLYFLSDRDFNPMLGGFNFEHVYRNTTRVMALRLASATPPPLPGAARSAGFDLQQWATGAEEEPVTPETAEPDAVDAENEPLEDEIILVEGESENMRVDTDGLASRVVILPIEPGNYGGLEAIKGGILYLASPATGLLDDNGGGGMMQGDATLHRYDFVKEKSEQIAENLGSYALSRDGTTLAIPADGAFSVRKLDGGGEPETLALNDVRVRINIQEEWRQIFDEAWRLQRDFYWAPNMVGVDWPAMKEKYAALLPRIGTRDELNDLIGELIGELGTSHTYIWGGEQHDAAESVSVGLLGADIVFDRGAFRITNIVSEQDWNSEPRSPLDHSYLNVKEGDIVLAANGAPLFTNSNVYDLLQDLAGKDVRLTVADDGGVNRRTVEVKTIGNERELRYMAWVEKNRQYVEQRSDGKIGYLHIPNMGGDGLAAFSRLFYPQVRKPALLVDIRDNGGGFVSQMIIQRLARTPIAYDQPRHGLTYRYPYQATFSHKAVVMDQHAGSDGDIFPAAFRMLDLGPLIGTRTWGGVVGIRSDKPFVDSGMSTQPEFAWWDVAEGWSIENKGVEPDIKVVITPEDRAAGRDPQLETAIDYLLQKLEEDPKTVPDVPAYPVRAPR